MIDKSKIENRKLQLHCHRRDRIIDRPSKKSDDDYPEPGGNAAGCFTSFYEELLLIALAICIDHKRNDTIHHIMLGETFDGNLRRDHLRADTPYNTYTRGGLTPTPISMPGKGALAAAANPGRTSALYFVSRGDGTSEFSETLDSHNRAVNRYQRKVR